MPELPELQAHAERLTEAYAGAALTGFRPLSFTALKTVQPSPDDAIGVPLDDVTRRGKYLLLRFGEVRFVVHLMQGGRLEPDPKRSAKPRGGLARWLFDDGGGREPLLLTEQAKEKRAGVWVVPADADLDTVDPTSGLGPDADTLDLATLTERLGVRSMRLHGFLRDQRLVAGLGRRLANEICHTAKLSPFASTSKLTDDEVVRLLDAIGACVEESLAYERTRETMSSSKDRPGAVHQHTGDPCPVCGDEVRSVEYSAYTVNYCATCQTGGKVLADNTTSKFLK